MSIEIILFYFFALLALISAFTVILARNPIHSALALIFLFFNVTCILLLFEVEFLALIFLVVYIGAVTVLFLFVVMMLDLRKDETVKRTPTEKTFMFLTGVLFAAELVFAVENDLHSASEFSKRYLSLDLVYRATFLVRDIDTISVLLYTNYFYVFLLAGVVLLIAMIGAIHLTLNENILRKRQAYKEQIYKKPIDVVYLSDLKKKIRPLKDNE